MGRWLWLSVLLALSGAVLLPPDMDAAKKKEKKAVPVKIVKASETKFKHAKIVRPKESKKKGFLWFKKKDKDLVVKKRKPLKKQKLKLPVKRKSEADSPADQAVE